jgi:hypothetical protein
MFTETIRRLGRAKSSANQRARALATYMASPSICEGCAAAIMPRPGVKPTYFKQRRFCSKSCAVRFNNVKFPKRSKLPVPRCKRCRAAEVSVTPSGGGYNRLCEPCWAEDRAKLDGQTRAATTHATIRAHARGVLKRCKSKLACDWCGYDKHVECCHIKPVGEFASTATLSEINHLTNLRWLCPNCHWELDHGLRVEEEAAVAA